MTGVQTCALPISFVEVGQHLFRDVGVLHGIVDEARCGVAGHVINEIFVHRPSVDEALRAVGVVNRAAVKTVGFCLAVGQASGQPRVFAGLKSCGCRVGHKGINCGFERRRCGVTVLVGGQHEVGIIGQNVFFEERGFVHIGVVFAGEKAESEQKEKVFVHLEK